MSAERESAGAVTAAAARALGSALVDRVGNTPLLRFERVGREFAPVEFYAKAEWYNPGGSVKDRPALSMIRAGEAS
ncbi:MAG TPA: pyridoxal-phosphate dependent enzyme, partial [Candidatus Acidoferrales bacterium]|nr:pyridoxal-phosphate dependent enzyme [Candidatus Acidoferrales bacterium]